MEIHDELNKIHTLESELKAHEVQCEERWKTNFARLAEIDAQLSKIQNLIVGGGATTIVFLAGIIFSILI